LLGGDQGERAQDPGAAAFESIAHEE
jgi:hypothetical protein